ncbi:hypothetical protein [Streptomyces sp. NPDC048527]|uniref:hypothetical protein n=1 Tax=Streptomyces sp. NPDC048527 TaxID=3365568 RepID=UPI00372258D0
MSAYYEVRGGEMPAFGVALEVVLAAAVRAWEANRSWEEFLPLPPSHPLSVVDAQRATGEQMARLIGVGWSVAVEPVASPGLPGAEPDVEMADSAPDDEEPGEEPPEDEDPPGGLPRGGVPPEGDPSGGVQLDGTPFDELFDELSMVPEPNLDPDDEDVTRRRLEQEQRDWERRGSYGSHAPMRRREAEAEAGAEAGPSGAAPVGPVPGRQMPGTQAGAAGSPVPSAGQSTDSDGDDELWGRLVENLLDAGERLGARTLMAELTAAGSHFQGLMESDEQEELEASALEVVPSEDNVVQWRDLLELVAEAMRAGKAGSLAKLTEYQRNSADRTRTLAARTGPVPASDVHVETRPSPDGLFQGSFSLPLRGKSRRDAVDGKFLAEVNRFLAGLDTRELPFQDAVLLGFDSYRKQAALALKDGSRMSFAYSLLAQYFRPTASRKDHVMVFGPSIAKQKDALRDPLQRLDVPGQQLANLWNRWVWGSLTGGVPKSVADLVAFRPEPAEKELREIAQLILGDPEEWGKVLRWLRALRLLFGPMEEVQGQVFQGLLRRLAALERRWVRRGGVGVLTWNALVALVWGDRDLPARPAWTVGLFREALEKALRQAAPGPVEVPEPRYSVDLLPLLGPDSLKPTGAGPDRAAGELERLLRWAYPGLSGNPEALGEYAEALEALDEWRQSSGVGGALTESYLRKLVRAHAVAWRVPDLEFGEGLRMVLEAQARADLGLGRFEVGSEQARWDLAASPALFRSAGPNAGVSAQAVLLVRAVIGEGSLSGEQERKVARGADALTRLIGGDPLAEVDGAPRIEEVARRLLGLGADEQVGRSDYQKLFEELASADEADRAGSLAATRARRTARTLWAGGTQTGNQGNPGTGRNGTRHPVVPDPSQVRVQRHGSEDAEVQPALWGQQPVYDLWLKGDASHVSWAVNGIRYEVPWVEWAEGLKYDPLRLAQADRPVVLMLTNEGAWHAEFAQLVADTLGVTVYANRVHLENGQDTEQIATVSEAFRRVEPRTVAEEPTVGALWERTGLVEGLEALRELREAAGDVRGLTWAGVRAVVRAFYEEQGGEMPVFGVALDTVLAQAVAALNSGTTWEEFLPVPPSHPLAVPDMGTWPVVWLQGGVPVPAGSVRGLELRAVGGGLVGLSSLPDVFRPAAWEGRVFEEPVRDVSLVEFGEGGVVLEESALMELERPVFVVEVGGGAGGGELGAGDGTSLGVDWEEVGRYFGGALAAAGVRGGDWVVVVGRGAGGGPRGDALAVMRPLQVLANLWGVRVGAGPSLSALAGVSGQVPAHLQLSGGGEEEDPAAVLEWASPEPSEDELVALGARVGWDGDSESVLRWLRVVRAAFLLDGEDASEAGEHLGALRGFAALDVLRRDAARGAGVVAGPLTGEELLRILDGYYASSGVVRPESNVEMLFGFLAAVPVGAGASLADFLPGHQVSGTPALPAEADREAMDLTFYNPQLLDGESPDEDHWGETQPDDEFRFDYTQFERPADEQLGGQGLGDGMALGPWNPWNPLLSGEPSMLPDPILYDDDREEPEPEPEGVVEQSVQRESLLTWAYPGFGEAGPEAVSAYMRALSLLDDWLRSEDGDEDLTVAYLRKLVHAHMAEWDAPDMDFGEGLRMVLEEVARRSGVELRLAQLDAGSDAVEWDRAVLPALFKAGGTPGLSRRGVRVLQEVFDGQLVETQEEYRQLVDGLGALERLIGGDPLAVVGGVTRIDEVAQMVLHLGAGAPVNTPTRRRLIEWLGRAAGAGRAESQAAAAAYYLDIAKKLTGDATRMGHTDTATVGRNTANRHKFELDMSAIRVGAAKERVPAPWKEQAYPVRQGMSPTDGHVTWRRTDKVSYDVPLAVAAELLKHDPARIAPHHEELALLLTTTATAQDGLYARLNAGALGATVTYVRAMLGTTAYQHGTRAAVAPTLPQGASFQRVEPRTAPAAAGSVVELVWRRDGLVAGLEALRSLREAAGDVRGLTWAGVRAVVSAYYQVWNKPMPVFGEALDTVLAQAVRARAEKRSWEEFLPVPSWHPLAVVDTQRVTEQQLALVVAAGRRVAAEPVVWLQGGVPVPAGSVRGLELRAVGGGLVGLSSLPDVFRPAAWEGRVFEEPVRDVSLVEFGEGGVVLEESALMELERPVFVVEVGGGAGGGELGAGDGTSLGVDWEEVGRYFGGALAAAGVRGGDWVVVVGRGAGGGPRGDALAVMRPLQVLANLWGVRVGAGPSLSALAGVSGQVPAHLQLSGGGEEEDPAAVLEWASPEPSEDELVALGARVGWDGDSESV